MQLLLSCGRFYLIQLKEKEVLRYERLAYSVSVGNLYRFRSTWLRCLILFGLTRYKFQKQRLSKTFILLFIGFTAIEALLAWYIFSLTGEIGTFQIIVSIFVLYAITFGYQDFKKLDRWMRKKIDADGLLTEKDYEEMKRQKDPRYQSTYYLKTWLIHVAVFLLAQTLFFGLSGLNFEQSLAYLTDLSWFDSETYEPTPYANEMLHGIAMIWGIVFVIDSIVSATYIFQRKDKPQAD